MSRWNRTPRLLPLLLALLPAVPLAMSSPAFAVRQEAEEVRVGQPLPVCSASAASGALALSEPFNAKTFGTVRGYSPATEPGSKIVIYARSLDRGFFQLAGAVDALVAKRPELAKSFVQVIDAKGAQRGGYTADEVTARLTEIRQLAIRNRVTHLSFALSAPGANSISSRLGINGETGVLVTAVVAGPEAHSHPVVDWLVRTEVGASYRVGTERNRGGARKGVSGEGDCG